MTQTLRAWAAELAPGGAVLLHWSQVHEQRSAGKPGVDIHRLSHQNLTHHFRRAGLVVDDVLHLHVFAEKYGNDWERRRIYVLRPRNRLG